MNPELDSPSRSPTGNGGGGEAGGKNRIPWDDVFDLLAAKRRRLALEYVARTRGPSDVQDVVDWVFDRQDADDDGETTRKATYVALHQVHFPKLVDYGVLIWDQDDGKVYLGENGPQVVDAMARTVGRADDDRGFRDRLTDWF